MAWRIVRWDSSTLRSRLSTRALTSCTPCRASSSFVPRRTMARMTPMSPSNTPRPIKAFQQVSGLPRVVIVRVAVVRGVVVRRAGAAGVAGVAGGGGGAAGGVAAGGVGAGVGAGAGAGFGRRSLIVILPRPVTSLPVTSTAVATSSAASKKPKPLGLPEASTTTEILSIFAASMPRPSGAAFVRKSLRAVASSAWVFEVSSPPTCFSLDISVPPSSCVSGNPGARTQNCSKAPVARSSVTHWLGSGVV